jgi:hypothetical protein
VRDLSGTPPSAQLLGQALRIGTIIVGFGVFIIIIATSRWFSRAESLTYIVGALTFFTLILTLPNLRIGSSQVLNPRNLLFISFGLKIVVVPIIIGLSGYSLGLLPNLPSTSYIVLAHAVYVVAMISSFLGFSFSFSKSKQQIYWAISNWQALLVILASLASAVYSLLGLNDNIQGSSSPGSITGVMVSFMKALAPIGVLYIVFGRFEMLPNRIKVSWKTIVAAILMTILTLSTNRASVIYPLLALFTAYTLYNLRVRYLNLAVFGLLGITAAFYAGQYREQLIMGANGTRTHGSMSQTARAIESAQVYFNGPQFGGYALRELSQQTSTFIPSLFESTPVLGKQYRRSSGSYWYNFSIYRNLRSQDQVYPAPIEVFINFGWLGLITFYMVIGLIISKLHTIFLSSQLNIHLAYVSAYISILICATVNLSLSVLGQFMFYNAIPFLIYTVVIKSKKFTL